MASVENLVCIPKGTGSPVVRGGKLGAILAFRKRIPGQLGVNDSILSEFLVLCILFT